MRFKHGTAAAALPAGNGRQCYHLLSAACSSCFARDGGALETGGPLKQNDALSCRSPRSPQTHEVSSRSGVCSTQRPKNLQGGIWGAQPMAPRDRRYSAAKVECTTSPGTDIEIQHRVTLLSTWCREEDDEHEGGAVRPRHSSSNPARRMARSKAWPDHRRSFAHCRWSILQSPVGRV